MANNRDSSLEYFSKWGCDTNFWRKEGWGQQHVLSTCGNHARDRLSTCWCVERSPRHTHSPVLPPAPVLPDSEPPQGSIQTAQSSAPKLPPNSSPSSIKDSALVAHLRMEAIPDLTLNSDLLRICMDFFIWQNLSPKKGSESDDGGRSLKEGQRFPSVRLWDLQQQPQHLDLSEGKTENWNRKNEKEVSPT